MSWEGWNESINKLDTRTKTVAGKRGKYVDRCSKTGAEYIQQMKTNRNLQDNTNDQPKETN